MMWKMNSHAYALKNKQFNRFKIISLIILVMLILNVSMMPIVSLAVTIGTSSQGVQTLNFIIGPFEYYTINTGTSISEVRISSDGGKLVFGNVGGKISYMRMNLEPIWSWTLIGEIVSVKPSRDFSKFIVMTRNRQVFLINSAGVIEEVWERGFRGDLEVLALDSKALKIAVSDTLGYVYVLDAKNPYGRREARTNATITDLSYLLSRDGFSSESLAVAINNYKLQTENLMYIGGVIVTYDLTVGDGNIPLENSIIELIPVNQSVGPIAYFIGPTGDRFVALGGYVENVNHIIVLDLKSKKVIVQPQYPLGYPVGGKVIDVIASRDGRYVIAASNDYNVYVLKWNGRYYEYYWSVSVGAPVSSIALSWDGKVIAVGSSNGWIYLISIDGDVLWKVNLGINNLITSIDLSDDGNVLVVGFSDGTIALLKGVKRKMLNLIITLETPNVNTPFEITVSPAGKSENYTCTLPPTSKARFLLPPGIYTIKIDNEDIGVSTFTFDLTVDSQLKITPLMFKMPTYTLKVKIVDSETGEPISNAIVDIHNVKKGTVETLKTNEFGTLEVILPRGEYVISTVKSGYVESERYNIMLRSNLTLTIPLKPATVTLNIQVLGLSNKPVENTQIYINGELVGTTGPNGSLNIPLKVGKYDLTVKAKHYEEFNATIDTSQVESIRVYLNPKIYSLKLNIVDSETKVAIGNVKVEVLYDKTKVLEKMITRENNTIELPFGNYTLKFEAKHYIPLQRKVSVVRNETLEVPLLKTSYPLIVNVKNDVGEFIEGAKVTAEIPQLGFKSEIQSDSTGKAILQLKYGAYMLKVEAPGYKPYEQVVTVEGPVTVDVVLEPGITIVLQRLLPYIAGVIVIAIIIVFLLIRIRRRIIAPEEEEEEILE